MKIVKLVVSKARRQKFSPVVNCKMKTELTIVSGFLSQPIYFFPGLNFEQINLVNSAHVPDHFFNWQKEVVPFCKGTQTL